MHNAERVVVFLYSERFVPPEILAFAAEQVPPGFCLHALDQAAPAEERLAAFESADYVLAFPGDPCAAELANAKRLKLFQMLSAGHDWLDLDIFRQHAITVATNDGANAPTVAEHAVLLMLALLRQVIPHHEALRRGDWLGMRHTMQLRELRGRTIGLVGFGQIGQAVARRLSGFDVQLRYTARHVSDSAAARDCGARYVSFDELLATSDIVSLHIPLNAVTRHLIDARAIASMQAGSWIVNTARGGLVDEAALVEALRSGHLAGAGLDVFAVEPLARDSPLLALDNVVLSPHIAGTTVDTWARRLALAWSNVQRVESGLPPLSRIA